MLHDYGKKRKKEVRIMIEQRRDKKKVARSKKQEDRR